jgi:hypothetical protein
VRGDIRDDADRIRRTFTPRGGKVAGRRALQHSPVSAADAARVRMTPKVVVWKVRASCATVKRK